MLSKTKTIELIRQGESSSVEFKRSEANANSIAKEMIAFANLKGGVLLIGVSDDGSIQGLSGDRKDEEWVANIARNNIIPSLQVDYSLVDIDGKKVAVISIPKGKDKPYQSVDGKYFIRIGSSNRVATQQELLRLFQVSGVFHYDGNPVSSTSLKDLNFTKLDNYFQHYSIHFSQESEEQKRNLLQNVDILADTGEVTVGGLLIFGINPSRYLFQNGIAFACFLGKTIDEELLDKQNIDGNIDYLIDTGIAVIKNRLKTPSTIQNAKRKDTKFLYPDKVFRELLTNAVVHRNYSIVGSKIRLFLFEDRLEVISPGRLPNAVTIEKLPFGVSFAVNPILVKFMENLRYMDQLGRGLPMVHQEATSHGKQVTFEEFGEEFKVVLEL